MNDQDRVVRLEHDELKEVPGPVGAGEEEPGWIVVKLDPCDRVLERVDDVVVRDIMPSGGPMDFHTE